MTPPPEIGRVHVSSDLDSATRLAASRIEDMAAEAVDQRHVAHIALAGGETPIPTYELAARRIGDWSRIEVWFGDERAVPPDDPESNYRAVSAALAPAQGLDPASVHRIEGELGAETAADRYGEAVRERVKVSSAGVPVLDLAFQGIGPDGHTASLFPGNPAVEADGTCVPVHNSPKPPPDRVTLTVPVLRAARRIVFLVAGKEKAHAVARMLAGEDPQVPSSLLVGPKTELILDRAAAGELPDRR
jgi:6-phosphogluconolactonase